MTETVVLIGGPADGHRFNLSEPLPWLKIRPQLPVPLVTDPVPLFEKAPEVLYNRATLGGERGRFAFYMVEGMTYDEALPLLLKQYDGTSSGGWRKRDDAIVQTERPGLMLVRVAGSTPAVYFVIDQPFYDHNDVAGSAEHDRHQRYWVDEHTCPTNIVPVEAIVRDGDADPHGVLEYVAHVEKPDGWEEEEMSDDIGCLADLFPCLKERPSC